MPSVTNGRLLYIAHPTEFQVPGIHTEYVEEQIDLDNVPLNGGVLIKSLALSSDPYVRKRMKDSKSKRDIAPLKLGHPWVFYFGYHRGAATHHNICGVIIYSVDNHGVGIIIRSEKPEFKPGDYVYGLLCEYM